MNTSSHLGFVSFGGGMILAELLGRDQWKVTVAGQDNPAMARTLTERYRGEYHGPADGDYARFILQSLARDVDGVAVCISRPTPPDAIP